MTRASCFALVCAAVAWSATPGAASKIPLQRGLTVVTASHWPEAGDYETIKRVTSADDRAVTVVVTGDTTATRNNPLGSLLGTASASVKQQARPFRSRRSISREDLQNAREYRQIFEEDAPEWFPGTTALGPSAAVLLRALKTRGESALTIANYAAAGRGIAGPGGLLDGVFDRQGRVGSDGPRASGVLRRVNGGTSSILVLVNGTMASLTVVHARGKLGAADCEFLFLDDEDNPLAIRFSIGENRLQVVRIEFPVAASTIQQQLASTGKVDVYGIYFDFASDRIKEESEPVLAEIARVLAGNPAWTLNVHGHTDNIGSDAFNLELSTRRAAAVKQALIARYKVAQARLSTGGFGESRPIETNDTLEGRARNRRVELRR